MFLSYGYFSTDALYFLRFKFYETGGNVIKYNNAIFDEYHEAPSMAFPVSPERGEVIAINFKLWVWKWPIKLCFTYGNIFNAYLFQYTPQINNFVSQMIDIQVCKERISEILILKTFQTIWNY